MSRPEDDASGEDQPKWAPPPPELVMQLPKPIELNGQVYEALTLREPTAGEMKAIRAKPVTDQQIYMVSLIAGIPEKAVERMPVSVIERAENYIAGFIPPARTIYAA